MKTLLLSITLLFTASQLQAQSTNPPVYDNEGFFINASLLGKIWSIDSPDFDSESGFGVGLKIGYNFNTNFGLFTALDVANLESDMGNSYILTHFDLGVQGTFRTTEDRFRPFLRASVLGFSVQDDLIERSGAGFGLGGGSLIFLSEKLALDINYTHAFINISEFKIGSVAIDIDENATSGRFLIGLAYYF
ncbi:MAG: outer membrane beta-barrel protein [Balneolaceae bacterium]|nr:outer membrane beta-barrel protein [Balneolaceae bacterium]